MSTATLTPAAGDFDDWEREIADDQRRRPARPVEKRTAIAESAGWRRHRTREHEAN